MGEFVTNQPLREAFERCGKPASEVARQLGWYRMDKGRKVPDGDRVRRDLGLRRVTGGRNRLTHYHKRVRYSRAVEFARAIGVDPVDVEL